MKQAPPALTFEPRQAHLAHETAKEVPMGIYCGVDFHARQQTFCYCDTPVGNPGNPLDQPSLP